MSARLKAILSVICAVVALGSIYCGISCVATFCKAAAQPYLMSGDVRFDFMGYYITASVFGGFCLVGLAALTVLLFVIFRKRVKKQ